ncbi:MAG: hypothetical protein ACM3PY_01890, partial [Omnitrophica WOR_2 bacterium]
GFKLPTSLQLWKWNPVELFGSSPALLADRLSWPYAAVLATLVLAVILTAVARVQPLAWEIWAGSLLLTALGLFAVLAGNPLTLLMAWAALDIVELIFLLLQLKENEARERIVASFSARLAGIILLLWAWIVARSTKETFTFASVPQQATIFLVLAAGLRLGVLPLHLPFYQELPLQRGLGTIIRLVPVAASLVLLTRAAVAGVPLWISPYLLALAGLAALYGGWAWLTASDELSGRPFWIIGMSALSVTAALRAQPGASIAWGIACLMSGGLLFLASARHRNLLPLLILGLLGFSALPLTPAWNGMGIYAYPRLMQTSGIAGNLEKPAIYLVYTLVFLIAHALLLAGYIRFILRQGVTLKGVERWVWVIYPLGLFLIICSQYFLGFWSWPKFSAVNSPGWWGGATAAILTVIIWVLSNRKTALPENTMANWRYIFSFNWLYRFFWLAYQGIGRLVSWSTMILEGEGGLLWTLVLLALIFSLVAQRSLGGLP